MKSFSYPKPERKKKDFRVVINRELLKQKIIKPFFFFAALEKHACRFIYVINYHQSCRIIIIHGNSRSELLQSSQNQKENNVILQIISGV